MLGGGLSLLPLGALCAGAGAGVGAGVGMGTPGPGRLMRRSFDIAFCAAFQGASPCI